MRRANVGEIVKIGARHRVTVAPRRLSRKESAQIEAITHLTLCERAEMLDEKTLGETGAQSSQGSAHLELK